VTPFVFLTSVSCNFLVFSIFAPGAHFGHRPPSVSVFAWRGPVWLFFFELNCAHFFLALTAPSPSGVLGQSPDLTSSSDVTFAGYPVLFDHPPIPTSFIAGSVLSAFAFFGFHDFRSGLLSLFSFSSLEPWAPFLHRNYPDFPFTPAA